MNLSALKRAPRWAYYVAAGVTGGAVLIYTINHRNKPADDAAATDQTPVGDGYNQTWDGSPTGTGIVTPPVIISGSGDDVGSTDLQQLYMGGVSDLLNQWDQAFGTVGTTIFDSVRLGADIHGEGVGQGIGYGGGVPSTPGPSGGGTPTAPAAVPAGPAPCPGGFPIRGSDGCYKLEYDNRTRNSGKNYWCNRVTIHRYADGHAVVTAEDKIKNGAC